MQVLVNFFTNMVKRFIPNAFLFAVMLTFIVLVGGLLVNNTAGASNSMFDMINFWGKGFWGFLAFGMQMLLIVITGSTLSNSPPVKAGLVWLTNFVNTPKQAILMTTYITMFASLLHWGFGLIVGAILAKRIAKKVTNVHYPLLIACGYGGFVIWHGGLSGSIPLKVASVGDAAVNAVIGQGAVIPISQTLLHPANIFILIVMFAILPMFMWFMYPKNEKDVISIDPVVLEEMDTIDRGMKEPDRSKFTFANHLEYSRLISLTMALMGFVFIYTYFTKNNGNVSLDIVIFSFLMLSIGLYKNPISFVYAFQEGFKSGSGIVLQFPFYAGMMGMMIHSGLADSITHFFTSVATTFSYPVYAFIASGVLDIFVPSGGGKWGVEGHFMLSAASALNVDMGKTIVAVSWGDAWTNMIQPFWALPLLSVAKLDIKDIMCYTTLVMILTGVVVIAGLLLF